MPKFVRVLFVLLVLALLFIPTLIVVKYLTIMQVYSYFTDHIASLLGMNIYLIRTAIMLAMVPFFYAIRLYLSLDSRRRRIGAAIMTGFVVFYNLGLYFATKDQFFTFREGKIIRWYALTQDGVKFYDRPGVDPSYGIPLKPVTPEVIRTLRTIEKGDFRMADPTKASWFNPITGDPQLWYSLGRDGVFEFYYMPGHHPFTNEALKPVTQDVYYRWRERAQVATRFAARSASRSGSEGELLELAKKPLSASTQPDRIDFRQQRLNELKSLVSPVASGRTHAVALLVEAPSVELQQALYSQLRSDRVRIHTGVFGDRIFRCGLFEELYQGNGEMIRAATSHGRVKWLVLGRLQHSFRKTAQVDSDLVTCDLSLACKVMTQSGDLMKSDSLVSPVRASQSRRL